MDELLNEIVETFLIIGKNNIEQINEANSRFFEWQKNPNVFPLVIRLFEHPDLHQLD